MYAEPMAIGLRNLCWSLQQVSTEERERKGLRPGLWFDHTAGSGREMSLQPSLEEREGKE